MVRARVVAMALAVLAAGCGSHGNGPSSSPTPTPRPTSDAHLRILAPRSGQVVAKQVVIRLDVQGAVVLDPSDVTATSGGHIHLYVDGRLVKMTRDVVVHVTLPAGPHNIRAEFVAPDHAPFRNPIVATVTFTVRA